MIFKSIKQFFVLGGKADLAQIARLGATIIDVRTKDEFEGGHIKDSINIPVDVLGNNFNIIPKDKPIITCCASGMRSNAATRILKDNAFKEVYNGGGWRSLQSKIR